MLHAWASAIHHSMTYRDQEVSGRLMPQVQQPPQQAHPEGCVMELDPLPGGSHKCSRVSGTCHPWPLNRVALVMLVESGPARASWELGGGGATGGHATPVWGGAGCRRGQEGAPTVDTC
jgi:hypothetical protein